MSAHIVGKVFPRSSKYWNPMFIRLVADSFSRRPRHKLLTGAALALGMAVATAALSVSLDVGDRLAREFRSLGANLLVTPQADSLPLEIGGVDYRPVNAGAYLPESDLAKLKTIFWRNNIIAFAPSLEISDQVTPHSHGDKPGGDGNSWGPVPLIGTWVSHTMTLADGTNWQTGVDRTNPWWTIAKGRWFTDGAAECVVGKNLASKHGVWVGGHFLPGLPVGDNLIVNLHADGTPLSLKIVGILDTGGPEDDAVVVPLSIAQAIAGRPGEYRQLYVSALTKPEDDFGRRDPSTLAPADYDRWYCSPYISSIALQIKQVLPGADVRVIRRVADGEGAILTRVRTLLWLVTFASLLAAALAVGASSAASVIERRTEIGLMKALGAGSGTVGFLLAAEQLLLALVGGGLGYSLGILLARVVGQKIFGAAPAFSFLVLAVIVGLAAIVTLIGSAIPLRRASRYEPAPILRGE
jgi:putative ABC transport system permease protein